MTKNLITPSIISKKYGLLTKEKAKEDSKKIEELAFATVNQYNEKEPDGDGSSVVQIYAKESSKLILELLKRSPCVKKDGETITTKNATNSHAYTFDISGGLRAFISIKEVEKLLKPLKERGNSYTKICFSNRSFGLDVTPIVELILASIKDQLMEVDLLDSVARRPVSEALKVMKIFSYFLESCSLRYLNLSNNALGEKGIKVFGLLLESHNNFEELYLINDCILEEATHVICKLIPSTKKLKILQFYNNMTGDEGAIVIAEMVRHFTILEDFLCSSTRVGLEGGVALAEAFGTCTHLKKLDLRDNMSGVTTGLALSKSLFSFENLIEVYLSYINLEDEGVKALGNALRDFAPSLDALEMARNDIMAKCATFLATCIA